MQLRPYQEEAVEAIFAELKDGPSTLAVMATGLGKTVVFAKVAERMADYGKRTLILAHRAELVEQAAEKIEKITGITPAIEMAERKDCHADNDLFGPSQIVIASVQSMIKRLDRFPRGYFDLVVRDEAHRAVTATDVAISEHFQGGGAKLLGVTATPQRGDKAALGQIYQSVAVDFDIADGIDAGWLVPIQQEQIEVDIDFSQCRTTAGDLNQGDLSTVMSERQALYGIAGPTVTIAGDRPTLVFAVTVAHAQLLAEVIGEYTQAGVAILHGGTDRDERRDTVARYKRGEIQFLVNCALFTEGFDAPTTAVVAMARPTKSTLMYKQAIGRSTRALEGVVDAYAQGTPEQRRKAIAESAKPRATILDFVGNSGRHSLCSASDALGGTMTKPEAELTKSILKDGETNDVLEAFRRAKKKIADLELARMRAAAKRNFKRRVVNPFQAFGIQPIDDPYQIPMTERQEAMLKKAKIPCEGLGRRQASQLISSIIDRRNHDRASYGQMNLLLKRNLDPKKVERMTFTQAGRLIDQLSNNKWREPEGWGSEWK